MLWRRNADVGEHDFARVLSARKLREAELLGMKSHRDGCAHRIAKKLPC